MTELLYGDLAEWWPLVSPPEEYEEEAGVYARMLRQASDPPPREVLELGSGGGSNAWYLKREFELTLVDVSDDMLAVSRRLNPECRHVQGDMRALRLGREFDAVFVHDAIGYMTTTQDLAAAIETVAAHTRAGGVALLLPDETAETFRPDASMGGADEPGRGSEGRGARFLEWSLPPRPGETVYEMHFSFLLRERDGSVRQVHDVHRQGLFPRAAWLDLMRTAGLEPMLLRRTLTEGEFDAFLGRKA